MGGLGLFLLGLRLFTDALKRLAGDRLPALLARLTTNRLTAVVTGILVTAIVQSSSITTVLAVGFVSAGVMSFQQSLGVVLGANVGSTITAQVIAFDLETWAFALVAIGSLGLAFDRGGRFEARAGAFLGLGLVFVGMQVMGAALAPFRDHPGFVAGMAGLTQPALGVGAGALFTALVQSSSATTAVVIALAGQGLLGPEAGVAIIVGANIGTCFTAALAAIGKPIPARRVAAFHILVNVIGALLWIGFLDVLSHWAAAITPGTSGTDLARQLANAHTIFNVSVLLVLFPFVGPLGRLVERLVPDKAGAAAEDSGGHLDRSLLSAPALALAAARAELGNLGEEVAGMVERAPELVLSGDPEGLRRLAADDDAVDAGYRDLIGYLSALGSGPLSSEQTEEVVILLAATDALENIGDIVETNLTALGQRRAEAGVRLPAARRAEIGAINATILEALRSACDSITQPDAVLAAEVLGRKRAVHDGIDELLRRAAGEIEASDPASLEAYTLLAGILEQLRRVMYFARRIARARLGLRPGGGGARTSAPADHLGPEPPAVPGDDRP